MSNEMTITQRVEELQSNYDTLYERAIVLRDEAIEFNTDSELQGEERSTAWANLQARQNELQSLLKPMRTELDAALNEERDYHRLTDSDGRALDNSNNPVSMMPQLNKSESKQINFGAWARQRMNTDVNKRDYSGIEDTEKLITETTKRAAHNDKIIGCVPRGEHIPGEVLFSSRYNQRQLTATGADTGDVIIPQDYRGDLFIDRLRNKSTVMAAGADVLNGLIGDLDIPRLLSSGQTDWTGETVAAVELLMTFGLLSFRVHNLRYTQSWTKQLEMQSDPMIEKLIVDDMMKQFATEIDYTALNGDSATDTDQPDGVANYTGVPTISLNVVPTWANMVSFETVADGNNAPDGSRRYITSPGIKGVLKTTPKESGQALYPWTDQETVNGYPADATNQVLTNLGGANDEHQIFFGNFNDLMIGFWGGMDVVIDPWTAVAQSIKMIHAFMMMDFQLRHANSFAYCDNARVTT